MGKEIRILWQIVARSDSHRLVQVQILGAGLLEDGYARVSVFPKHEEIFVSGFCFGLVSR
jgi:hypothetical protein